VSYLAIARKYRPATFDEIVGQEHVTRTLRNAIERNRIHHGFLFTGARGVGKTTAARALARALNCEKGPTADPCGVCTSCVEIGGGRSPDLIEIDGASNNSVEDVRELRETVRYAPTAGRWKIYLIDEVHMLSKGAFNALLKTLEEPPPHVVFIFATTEPNRIPDTILSRVQRFDFKRIPVPGVVARLSEIAVSEGVTISEGALKMIARAGEGSMRDAQSLLDQVISYAGDKIADDQVVETLGLIDRSLLYDMLAGLVGGRPDLCLTAINQVYSYGYELSEFTGEMLEVVRNAAFCRLSERSRDFIDINADELARLDKITEGVDAETLTRTFNALLDVHDQVSRSARPRIVLEMAVARLATVRPIQPVGVLLGRLEAMERRLREGGSSAGPSHQRGGRSPRSSSSSPPKGGGRDDRPRPAPVAREVTTKDAPKPPNSGRPKASVRPAEPPAERQQPRAQGTQHRPSTDAGQPEPPVDQSFYDSLGSRGRTDEVPIQPTREPRRKKPVPGTPKSVELGGDGRWDLFRGFIGNSVFGKGIPQWDGKGPLRVAFTRPRQVAEARRELKGDRIHSAVAKAYPEGTVIEVLDRAKTGNVSDDLMRMSLGDPRVTAIVEALGATAERAFPIARKRLEESDQEDSE